MLLTESDLYLDNLSPFLAKVNRQFNYHDDVERRVLAINSCAWSNADTIGSTGVFVRADNGVLSSLLTVYAIPNRPEFILSNFRSLGGREEIVDLAKDALEYMTDLGYHSFYMSRTASRRNFFQRYQWFRERYILFVDSRPGEREFELHNKLRGGLENQVIYKAVHRSRLEYLRLG